MGIETIGYVFAFLTLLALSAFFSGSETAFYSLPHSVLNQFRNSDDKSENRIAALMQYPRRLLISIVIGNTVVNITIASLAAWLTARMTHSSEFISWKFYGMDAELLAMFVDVIVVTFVILITSEILPKVIAIRNARAFAQKAITPLMLFVTLFKWASVPLARFSEWLQNLGGLAEDRPMLSEGEIKALVDVGEEHGTLQKDEKEMIHSIFEFGETTVKEVMVPRTDMVCIDTDTALSELMELVKSKPFSRIPVYRERIDNVIGLLYIKDLLPLLNKRSGKFNLQKIVRPAYFVPEQKKIQELLREFQQERMHMAVVVDEYGGVSGLVTLEDIIEEIVGEIQDEYDKESPLFNKVDDRTIIVDGRMALDEINEEFMLDLPTEQGVETISGFILNLLRTLPKEKETARFNGYTFVVEEMDRHRILKVKIKKDTPNRNIEHEVSH